MAETLSLPVLPLDDAVVLPSMVVPLDISAPEARSAIEAAQLAAKTAGADDDAKVLLVPRPDGSYSSVGTLATIEQVGRLPSGERAAVVRGVARVRIGTGTVGPGAALWVQGTVIDEPEPGQKGRRAGPRVPRPGRHDPAEARRLAVRGRAAADHRPGPLADIAGYAPYLTASRSASCWRPWTSTQRLELLIAWARDHLAELDVAETISNDVKEGMEKQQREFLLRQQLAAIRKELAELDGKPASEEEDYRARVEAADLPEKVREAALKEVAKLERGSDQSPEAGWIRTWLDTLLELPWNERTEDAYDIAGARAVLDADHAGLDDVKDRIIEYLAVRKRRVGPRAAARGRAAQRRGARRSSVRPASARPRSASQWPARWAASSPASRSAACGTRPRSAVTAAPTSARCPAGSSGPSPRPAR